MGYVKTIENRCIWQLSCSRLHMIEILIRMCSNKSPEVGNFKVDSSAWKCQDPECAAADSLGFSFMAAIWLPQLPTSHPHTGIPSQNRRRESERPYFFIFLFFIKEEVVLPAASLSISLARLSLTASSSCNRGWESNYLAKMNETATPGVGQLQFVLCCPHKMALVSNGEVVMGRWMGGFGICPRTPFILPPGPPFSLELPTIGILWCILPDVSAYLHVRWGRHLAIFLFFHAVGATILLFLSFSRVKNKPDRSKPEIGLKMDYKPAVVNEVWGKLAGRF